MQNQENNNVTISKKEKLRFFELIKKLKNNQHFSDWEIVEFGNLLLLYCDMNLGEYNPIIKVVGRTTNINDNEDTRGCYHPNDNLIEIRRNNFDTVKSENLIYLMDVFIHEQTHACNKLLHEYSRKNQLPDWQVNLVENFAKSIFLDSVVIGNILDVVNNLSDKSLFLSDDDVKDIEEQRRKLLSNYFIKFQEITKFAGIDVDFSNIDLNGDVKNIYNELIDTLLKVLEDYGNNSNNFTEEIGQILIDLYFLDSDLQKNLKTRDHLLYDIIQGSYCLRNSEKIARHNTIRVLTKTIKSLLAEPELDDDIKNWIKDKQISNLISTTKGELDILTSTNFLEFELFVDEVKKCFNKIDRHNLPCYETTYLNMFKIIIYTASHDELKKVYEFLVKDVINDKNYSNINFYLLNEFDKFIEHLPISDVTKNLQLINNFPQIEFAHDEDFLEPITVENYIKNKYDICYIENHNKRFILNKYNDKYIKNLSLMISRANNGEVLLDSEIVELYKICERSFSNNHSSLNSLKKESAKVINQILSNNQKVKDCKSEEDKTVKKLDVIYDFEKNVLGKLKAEENLNRRFEQIKNTKSILSRDLNFLKQVTDLRFYNLQYNVPCIFELNKNQEADANKIIIDYLVDNKMNVYDFICKTHETLSCIDLISVINKQIQSNQYKQANDVVKALICYYGDEGMNIGKKYIDASLNTMIEYLNNDHYSEEQIKFMREMISSGSGLSYLWSMIEDEFNIQDEENNEDEFNIQDEENNIVKEKIKKVQEKYFQKLGESGQFIF